MKIREFNCGGYHFTSNEGMSHCYKQEIKEDGTYGKKLRVSIEEFCNWYDQHIEEQYEKETTDNSIIPVTEEEVDADIQAWHIDIESLRKKDVTASELARYYGMTMRAAKNIIRRCNEINEAEANEEQDYEAEVDACIARRNIDIKALSKNDKISGYDLTAFFGVPVGLAEGVMRRIRAERDAAEEEQTEAAEEPDDGITEIVYDEGHIEYLTDNGFGEAEVLVSIEEFDEGYMVWKHIQLLGGTEWIASRKTIAEAKELAEHTIKRHREMEARLKEVRDDPHEFNRVLAEYE